MYNLMNAEDPALPEYPDVPPRTEREATKAADRVRLCFANATHRGERLWVYVTEVDGHRYQGIVDDDPTTDGFPERGAEIIFGPEHVLDIDP